MMGEEREIIVDGAFLLPLKEFDRLEEFTAIIPSQADFSE
jgi:hypothetical protein